MSLPPLNPRSSRLGSLAQSAREKKLKQARGLLIVLGVLVIVLTVVVLFSLKAEADKARQAGADPEQVQSQVRKLTVIGIISIALGIVYIILGVLVRAYPIPATVIGLILYLADTAITLVVIFQAKQEPKPFFYIVRAAIILAFIQAIQAAVAYQKERDAARAEEEMEPEYE
jgi:uncharacterized membrane protein HdeD (DUF308 family)